MAGNKSKKHISSIVYDFFVLTFFNIQTREGMKVSFTNVIWQVPSFNWLTVNIYGATRDCFGLVACSIFLKEVKVNVGSFSSFLGVQTSINVKFIRVIYTLEHAWMEDFQSLWFEIDSTLVCHDSMD